MGLSLTVLGSSAVFPRPDDPCSGYLLRTPQASVWVDCGPGTFAALQRHVDPYQLDALWLSHLHPDHCADLLAVFNWAVNVPNAPRFPVFGPPGWARRLAAMLPDDQAANHVNQAFEVHELYDQHTVEVGDLQLYSLAVQHSVPAFGLRAKYAAQVLAYSGDSGPCAALAELARNADVFVCEAGATEPQRMHCTPAEAGRAAAQARSNLLILTHVAHAVEKADAVEDARRTAGRAVEAANPGQQLVL